MELQYDGASRAQLREALEAYGLAPNKGLGQNFLCDQRACGAIVSAAGDLSQCHVLEIGPGPGALTVRLIQKGQASHGVGAGCGHVPAFGGEDRCGYIYSGAWGCAQGRFSGVGALWPCGGGGCNLPYYVTTPILMRLLQELPCAQTMVLMMQKEVAQRLLCSARQQDLWFVEHCSAVPCRGGDCAKSIACQFFPAA